VLLFLLAPVEFLLPGYSWICFSGLKERLSSLETLAVSFILSVGFTALFAAGLSLVTSHYLYYSVGGSLGLSLLLLITSIRRLRIGLPKLNRAVFPVLAIACVYSVMLAMVFWSSPFYPTADSSDPVTHAQAVEAISNGFARTTLLHSNFALGMHFAAAVLGEMLGFDSLDAIRLLLSIVIVFSIFLTYFCARTVLGSRYANLAVIASAFIVPVDATHFINIGTFPNVLSDALVIAMLWLIASYAREPNHSLGLTLTFLAVTGLFVHSTFVLFLGALWLTLPVFYISSNGYFRNYLKGLLFATAGLFVLLILLGSFAWASFERVFSGYVVPSFALTPLFLDLRIDYWVLYDYYVLVGPLVTLTIIATVVLILAKRRDVIWLTFLCIWFCLELVIAFTSPQDWRFILLSMVPGSFLLGISVGSLRGIGSLSPRLDWRRARRVLIPIVLCVLILTGSFPILLPRVFDPSSRIREEAIFASMSWLKQNDAGQSVASVGLYLGYRYLTALTGITYAGDFNESANSMVAQSRRVGFAYVVVSVHDPQFPTFESSSMVVEKYQNSVAAIFFIPA
jgi:hypothetical protein